MVSKPKDTVTEQNHGGVKNRRKCYNKTVMQSLRPQPALQESRFSQDKIFTQESHLKIKPKESQQ